MSISTGIQYHIAIYHTVSDIHCIIFAGWYIADIRYLKHCWRLTPTTYIIQQGQASTTIDFAS